MHLSCVSHTYTHTPNYTSVPVWSHSVVASYSLSETHTYGRKEFRVPCELTHNMYTSAVADPGGEPGPPLFSLCRASAYKFFAHAHKSGDGAELALHSSPLDQPLRSATGPRFFKKGEESESPLVRQLCVKRGMLELRVRTGARAAALALWN